MKYMEFIHTNLNHEGPPRSISRLPSCDECRRLHIKCDKQHPCDQCIRRQKECQYSQSRVPHHRSSHNHQEQQQQHHQQQQQQSSNQTNQSNSWVINVAAFPRHRRRLSSRSSNSDASENIREPPAQRRRCLPRRITKKEFTQMLVASCAHARESPVCCRATVPSDDPELGEYKSLLRSMSHSSDELRDLVILLTRPISSAHHVYLEGKETIAHFLANNMCPENSLPSNVGVAVFSHLSLPYFVLANNTLLNKFGYSLKELQQMPWQTLTHQHTTQKLEQRRDEIMQAPESEVVFEKRVLGLGVDRHGYVFEFAKEVTSLFRWTPEGYQYRGSRLVLHF